MWLAWLARPVLTPFLFAFIIAYLLAPWMDWCVQGGIPRILAVLITYAVVGGGLFTLSVYLTPLLVQQSLWLVHRLPEWTRALAAYWSYSLTRVHQAPIPELIRRLLAQSSSHIEARLFVILKSVLKTVFGLVPGILSIVVAPVLAFFILKDLERIRRTFWGLVPIGWRPGIFKLGVDIDDALNGFLRGQLLVALVVAVLASAWTFVLNIPFALLIGALAGITDVIPYVGPIVGAIPAVILALTVSPWKALYVVCGFIVIHQLEGTVIAPKVVGDSVGLHPLVVMFVLLVGGEVYGLVGLLLAVPLTAVGKVVLVHAIERLAECGLHRDKVTTSGDRSL